MHAYGVAGCRNNPAVLWYHFFRNHTCPLSSGRLGTVGFRRRLGAWSLVRARPFVRLCGRRCGRRLWFCGDCVGTRTRRDRLADVSGATPVCDGRFIAGSVEFLQPAFSKVDLMRIKAEVPDGAITNDNRWLPARRWIRVSGSGVASVATAAGKAGLVTHGATVDCRIAEVQLPTDLIVHRS